MRGVMYGLGHLALSALLVCALPAVAQDECGTETIGTGVVTIGEGGWDDQSTKDYRDYMEALEEVDAKHAVVFHLRGGAGALESGFVAFNRGPAYMTGYLTLGEKDESAKVVYLLNFSATLFALNDEMWRKYSPYFPASFGMEGSNFFDRYFDYRVDDYNPLGRCPRGFRAAGQLPWAQMSDPAPGRLPVEVIVCNTCLTGMAKIVAKRIGLAPFEGMPEWSETDENGDPIPAPSWPQVYQEFVHNLLDQRVVLSPEGAVTLEQLQRMGFSYMTQ